MNIAIKFQSSFSCLLLRQLERIKVYNAPGFFRGLNDMLNGKLWCKL